MRPLAHFKINQSGFEQLGVNICQNTLSEYPFPSPSSANPTDRCVYGYHSTLEPQGFTLDITGELMTGDRLMHPDHHPLSTLMPDCKSAFNPFSKCRQNQRPSIVRVLNLAGFATTIHGLGITCRAEYCLMFAGWESGA